MSRSRGCGEKINAKTRAVVFVGYGGRMGRLDEIITLCKKHGLKLILDAAHMSGTKVNGIYPGTWEGVDAYDHGTCPHAHEISRHIITLPLNLWLTDGDVDQIIKIVNCFPQDK